MSRAAGEPPHEAPESVSASSPRRAVRATRRVLRAVALSVLAVGAAGCSSADDPPPSASSILADGLGGGAESLAGRDEWCEVVVRYSASLDEIDDQDGGLAAFEANADEVDALWQELVDTAPSELRPLVEEVVADVRDLYASARAFEDGDLDEGEFRRVLENLNDDARSDLEDAATDICGLDEPFVF